LAVKAVLPLATGLAAGLGAGLAAALGAGLEAGLDTGFLAVADALPDTNLADLAADLAGATLVLALVDTITSPRYVTWRVTRITSPVMELL
jgi:hypothetical protein